MEGREGAEERGKMKGGLCSSKLFLGKTLLKTKQDRPIVTTELEAAVYNIMKNSDV